MVTPSRVAQSRWAFCWTEPETNGLPGRAGCLAEQDPDQTLYEGLMEGLGYRQNQHAFLLLAQRAGYGALHRAAIRLPAEERAPAIEHWLVTLSGLFSPEHGKPETLPRAGFGPPLSAQVWHCFRVRPANHPLRRIAGAARLVARFLHPELVEELRQVAASGSGCCQRPGPGSGSGGYWTGPRPGG